MEIQYRLYIYFLHAFDGFVALCLLLFTVKLWVIHVIAKDADPCLIISKLLSTVTGFCGVLLFTFDVMSNYNTKYKLLFAKIGLIGLTVLIMILLAVINSLDPQLKEIFIYSIFVPLLIAGSFAVEKFMPSKVREYFEKKNSGGDAFEIEGLIENMNIEALRQ